MHIFSGVLNCQQHFLRKKSIRHCFKLRTKLFFFPSVCAFLSHLPLARLFLNYFSQISFNTAQVLWILDYLFHTLPFPLLSGIFWLYQNYYFFHHPKEEEKEKVVIFSSTQVFGCVDDDDFVEKCLISLCTYFVWLSLCSIRFMNIDWLLTTWHNKID